MSASFSDRNLLFGLLALQMAFVTRDALLDGMPAWMARKADPLGRVLVERGALRPHQAQLLDALVDEHVARHHGDARQSLAALRVESEVRDDLGGLADPDVRQSVASLTAPNRRSAPLA